jgi:protein-tyrosine-phosphatase
MTATVLFLCPYGGAKSVIAAAYFNRAAAEHELPYRAMAAAVEEPYDAVPPPVIQRLAADGFDVASYKPRRVDAAAIAAATKVVSIDCDLTKLADPDATIEEWSGVPKVSDGVDAAADAIRWRVETLAAELRR